MFTTKAFVFAGRIAQVAAAFVTAQNATTGMASSPALRRLAQRACAILLGVALMTVSSKVGCGFPVPWTLQTMGAHLVGLMLTPRMAWAALGAWVALGMAGCPVFKSALGGVSVLAGPTGGYIWGCVLGAPLASWIYRRMRSADAKRTRMRCAHALSHLVAPFVSGCAVHVLAWTLGCTQLAMHTASFQTAFWCGVYPFLVTDICKVAFVAWMTRETASQGHAS